MADQVQAPSRLRPRPWPKSAAEFEAGYNNRALVPDHGRYLERWARDSAALRARGGADIDVAYGEGAAERLDVFAAHGGAARVAAEPAPVLLFIHGGWFRALDKSDHSFIAAPFVERGVHVVVPNYALCPSVGVETIVVQMLRAAAWTWRRFAAPRSGGMAPRLVVAGHSAGGHLAAMLACCDWRRFDAGLPARVVDAAVAVSGVFELESVMHTPFLQADLRLDAASVARLSPAWMPAPAVPVQAWVGADESALFRAQTRLLRRAWGEPIVPVCAELAGRHHFSVLDALAEPGSALFESTLSLLNP